MWKANRAKAVISGSPPAVPAGTDDDDESAVTTRLAAIEGVDVQKGLRNLRGDVSQAASPDSKLDDSPIDPQTLADVLGDDTARHLDILRKFIHQAERIIAESDKACGQRDIAQVSFLAHKLKSSARAVGADALADLCLSLEVAGRKEDWAGIDRVSHELRPAFECVRDYVNGQCVV